MRSLPAARHAAAAGSFLHAYAIRMCVLCVNNFKAEQFAELDDLILEVAVDERHVVSDCSLLLDRKSVV